MSAVTVANLRPSRSARIDSRQPTRPASSGCNARISVSANANRSPSGSLSETVEQKPANALRRRLLESDGKVDIPRSARPFRQPHLEGDATLHHPSLGICVHEAGKQALEHDVPSCTLDIETGAAASDVRWPAAAPGRSRTSRSFPFEQLHGSLDRERSGRAERVCAVEEQAPCERLKVRLRGSRHRGPM